MEDKGQKAFVLCPPSFVELGVPMPFKFEKLEVYQLALAYVDLTYDLSAQLPKSEEYNLRSQIVRAATSVALNIAEGSTAQSDAEQNRFLGMAVRSVLETVACQHIIRRRKFITDIVFLDKAEEEARILVAKLHAFRNSLKPNRQVRESESSYNIDET
jgi:four helix bundle protein